jgi:hypothetical protein
VIKAEQDLPGTEGGREERGEMIQTVYAHVNKGIKKKRILIFLENTHINLELF